MWIRRTLAPVELLLFAASVWLPAGASAQGFVEQAQLSLPGLGRGGNLLPASDLSADGNTALLGSPGVDCDAGVDCGAAYIFERQGGSWSQQAVLLPPMPQESELFFGYAVSLSGDGRTALVAAAPLICSQPPCVTGYVYVRSGSSWSEQARLTVPPSFYGGPFRGSRTVALSGDGDTALVASPFATSPCPAGATACGVVHVFVRSGGLWSEEDLLTNSGLFGFSVDLSRDGRRALVGKPGDSLDPGAIVFVRGGAGWMEEAVLRRTGPFPTGVDLSESGWTLSLSGDGNVALVSAPSDGCRHDLENPGPETFCGSVSVFSREGGVWHEEQTLTAPGVGFPLVADFESGLALSGDGSLALLTGENPQVGLFQRLGGRLVWTRQGIDRGWAPLALSDDGRTALTTTPSTAYIYVAGLTVADIPSLDGLGLTLLALLLAASGATLLVRRRRSH